MECVEANQMRNSRQLSARWLRLQPHEQPRDERTIRRESLSGSISQHHETMVTLLAAPNVMTRVRELLRNGLDIGSRLGFAEEDPMFGYC